MHVSLSAHIRGSLSAQHWAIKSSRSCCLADSLLTWTVYMFRYATYTHGDGDDIGIVHFIKTVFGLSQPIRTCGVDKRVYTVAVVTRAAVLWFD